MPSLKIMLCALLLSVANASAFAGKRSDCPGQRWAHPTEILAQIQTLQVDLLSHASATETLERWCATQGLANPAIVTVERAKNVYSPATPEVRQHLRVTPDTALKYRHVRLKCGEVVLSEADNWYVPARLTAPMNKTLDSTGIPFGKVVKPLGFTRQTLSATLLWPPLPETSRISNGLPSVNREHQQVLPYFLFEHRAVLRRLDGAPFSLLIERYTRNVLGP